MKKMYFEDIPKSMIETVIRLHNEDKRIIHIAKETGLSYHHVLKLVNDYEYMMRPEKATAENIKKIRQTELELIEQAKKIASEKNSDIKSYKKRLHLFSQTDPHEYRIWV